MLNRVVLIGRLTKQPELRVTPSGLSVSTFTLAVDRRITTQSGQREADFIDVVVFGKLAEITCKYMDKGRLVAVDGRIQTRSYETKDGQKRKAFEVVAENVEFLSPKPKREGGEDSGSSSNGSFNDGGSHDSQDEPDEDSEPADTPF